MALPPAKSRRHQEDGRPAFESVYPGVGVQGLVAAGERLMGLGRQKSRSAGEGVHSRLHPYPHPPANRWNYRGRHGVHPAYPDAVPGVGVRAGSCQPGHEKETGMGKGIGRHWSQSAGANVIPHPHADQRPALFICPAGAGR